MARSLASRKVANSELDIPADLLEGAPPLEVDGRVKVVYAKALSTELLESLFTEKHSAVVIRRYCPPAVAKRASQAIGRHFSDRHTYVSYGNKRVRTDMNFLSFCRTQAQSDAELRRYFSEAVPSLWKIRQAFYPNFSPIDRLRLELDELLRQGAHIEHNRYGMDFAGAIRLMTPGMLLPGIARREGVCHIDDPRVRGEPRIFSANIYLRVPRGGGHLKIWNIAFSRKNDRNPVFELIKRYPFHDGVQDLIYDRLPRPHVIQPRPGDLVILDSARPHSVTGFSQGDRMSLQTFLHYRNSATRLRIVS